MEYLECPNHSSVIDTMRGADLRSAALISVIENKLFAAILTPVFLLLPIVFAILFKVERRARRATYLLVMHLL